MDAIGKLAVLLIGIVLSGNAMAAITTCGTLDDNLLYSTDTTTEPKEYPWMGELYENNGPSISNSELLKNENRLTNLQCSIVIVSERYVLTTGSCVRGFRKTPEVLVVQVGIWNETHKAGERLVCNTKGFCVPGPVNHQVKQVLLHPSADKDTGDYDVALLELKQPIQWTRYIEPLCVEEFGEPKSWIGRNYHFGGFNHVDYIKGKGMAFAISRDYCTELGQLSTPPPSTHFCTFPERRTKFYLGAALMAINVEKDLPKNFYLAGIMIRHFGTDVTTIIFFQDIRPVRAWILNNIR